MNAIAHNGKKNKATVHVGLLFVDVVFFVCLFVCLFGKGK